MHIHPDLVIAVNIHHNSASLDHKLFKSNLSIPFLSANMAPSRIIHLRIFYKHGHWWASDCEVSLCYFQTSPNTNNRRYTRISLRDQDADGIRDLVHVRRASTVEWSYSQTQVQAGLFLTRPAFRFVLTSEPTSFVYSVWLDELLWYAENTEMQFIC